MFRYYLWVAHHYFYYKILVYWNHFVALIPYYLTFDAPTTIQPTRAINPSAKPKLNNYYSWAEIEHIHKTIREHPEYFGGSPVNP